MPEILTKGNLKHLDPECAVTCSGCRGTAIFKRSEGSAVQSTDQRDAGLYNFKCPTVGCGRTNVGYPKS